MLQILSFRHFFPFHKSVLSDSACLLCLCGMNVHVKALLAFLNAYFLFLTADKEMT